MTENEIAKENVDAAYHVHVALGPGLLINLMRQESGMAFTEL